MQSRTECSRLGAGCLSSKSQEFIPTGISSLDSILNGGYPLGALILIEDDLGVYSEIFTNYFLAEGIANRDYILLASRDTNPIHILKDLPPPVCKKEEVSHNPTGELKIAWRYQGNSLVQSSPSKQKSSFSHDFDFSSKVSEIDLDKSVLSVWPNDEKLTFDALFSHICYEISSKNLWFGEESKNINKKNLRLCVNNLGSPFWSNDHPLYEILLKIRTAVHNSASIALVTVPSKILERKVINRCEQISDIVISLNSLANTTNKQFAEYSGLMTFLKISPINSLSVHVPEDRDWGFKVKKKKLIIEKLHLPPETSVTDQREQDDLITKSNVNGLLCGRSMAF